MADGPYSPAGGATPGGKRSVYAHDEGTFDNGATISQMRFLARSYAATSDARYRDAFLRGVDYVLKAQYPSGGWPQVFPLAGNAPAAPTSDEVARALEQQYARTIGQRAQQAA